MERFIADPTFLLTLMKEIHSSVARLEFWEARKDTMSEDQYNLFTKIETMFMKHNILIVNKYKNWSMDEYGHLVSKND